MSLNSEERRAVVALEYEKAVNTFANIQTLAANSMWDLCILVFKRCVMSPTTIVHLLQPKRM